jgi:hypothetical protein
MRSNSNAPGSGLDDDLFKCKKCSYDLRARERFQRCPECGHWPYNSLKREYPEPGREVIYKLCLGISFIAGVSAFLSLIGLPQALAWSLASNATRWSWERFMQFEERALLPFIIAVVTAPCWVYVLARLARRFEAQSHRERHIRGFSVGPTQRKD